MIPVNISYPFFEANQVLSYEHLNQLFNYLDEQTRLSRTNLIGIGIVCGLRPSIIDDGNSIRISKGCGVTSEGYLIVWEDAFALEWYRPYTIPDELAYKEFEDRTTQPTQPFPMWELMADRNNDPNAVRLSSDFMRGNNQAVGEEDEKILVLFLECLAESNRNCTPNSCADKGTTVTATIRPILIRKQDIDLLQERIHGLGADAAAYFSLTDTMGSRFGLPTLKLPRYNVGASSLGGTTAIFDAFQLVMNQLLVDNIATALSDAYQAFQPLLTDFTSNPFNNLATQWAYFYDRSIENNGLYLWYQYYYDHLDTVIQAYEEFRLRGLEVLGLCCPDSRLFPRHLMLGNVGTDENPFAYRHDFVPSPLFSGQSGSLAELKLLFQRLVSIVQHLELPANISNYVNQNAGNYINYLTPIGTVDFPLETVTTQFFATYRPQLSTSIKITPSQLRRPLSEKAIPYHYTPLPLYQYWSYQKTRQQKARENLGYRSDSWNTTDFFVRFPLNYDLEPHNFLRIEGHIGQNYVLALQELLEQKERNRLPIDIIALKTGYNSDNIPLPNELANCHFQDLEVLYDAFREELICQICETVKHLYNIPTSTQEGNQELSNHAPRLEILRRCSPDFRYFTNSLGERFETILINSFGAFYDNLSHLISTLNQLANSVRNDLKSLDINAYRELYLLLNSIISANHNVEQHSGNSLNIILDNILYACKLESIQQIWNEYQNRLDKVRQAMLFSSYASKHPGLQHKAGVPLGGTFIMVYHGEDQPDDIVVQEGRQTIRGRVIADGAALIGATIIQLDTTNGTVTDLDGAFSLITYRLPVRLSISYVGFDTREVLVANIQTPLLIDLTAPATGNTIGRFADIAAGTVIADFYLPYLCCSDCQPVQFVLPKAPPTFTWEQMGCTDDNGNGGILITPAGGTPPYDYTTDSGANWTIVDDSLINVLNNAQIQIRDAEGTISVRRTISLTPPLVVNPDKYICQEDGLNFDIQVYISGGRPPYRIIANGQTTEVSVNQEFGLATFPSGQGGEVIVEDSSTPPCQKSFLADAMECTENCKLPCEGKTRECGYPFWMQRNPNQGVPYQEVTLKVQKLSIVDISTGQNIDFNASQLDRLTQILTPDRDFNSAGAFTSFWNNAFPSANEYIQNEIGNLFNSPEVPVLQLIYDPSSVERFTTLRIKHYECHQFNFEIELNFKGSTTKQIYNRKWFYSNEQAEVEEQSRIDGDNRTFEGGGKIPAYNCILSNRCNPDEPVVELCTKPFEVSISEEPIGDGRYQFFLNTDTGVELPALWMIEHAMPAIGQGELIETNLLFPIIYTVMVIVVDPETSCAAVARLPINNQGRS